jgi:phosphoglycolate phosphatase-like HAD superfamily hydrolase
VKLVLFDIDGTILHTHGAGKRAVHRALREVFGTTGPEGHRFDGKTDRQIVRELMTIAGHGDGHIDANMDEMLARYVRYLEHELSVATDAPLVYPGVPVLLDALEAREDVLLGLLTGNLEAGARAKIRSAGFAFERFRVSAFGSDAERRPELPAVAKARGEALLGRRFEGRDVVIIGDTPADVTCGNGIGARAIGVATGQYEEHELAEAGAWATFSTLADTEAVIDAILDRVADRVA